MSFYFIWTGISISKVENRFSQTSSLRLAYQDLSLESKKQSERLQKADPSKAQQLERLGMGIMGANAGPRYLLRWLMNESFTHAIWRCRTISHSVINDMTVIQQDSSAFSTANTSVLASLERKNYSASEESSNSFYSKYFLITARLSFESLMHFSVPSWQKFRSGWFVD